MPPPARPPGTNRFTRPYADTGRPVLFKNTEAFSCPPFAALECFGYDRPTDTQLIRRPTASALPGTTIFNGPVAVPKGAQGQAKTTCPAQVLFQSADGSLPAVGDVLGTVTGSWALAKSGVGFVVWRVPPAGGASVVLVQRQDAVSSPGSPGGPVTTAACNWIWGLYGIECFAATVALPTIPPYVSPSGSCVGINTAQGPIQLYPVGGGVLQWQSVKKFNTCLGSGTLFLDLTNKCCPQLIIQGVVPAGSGPPTDYPMELLGCGQDSMGNRIVDFGGGGPLVCNSYPTVTGCSACPSGAPKIWRFVLQSAGCATVPDGEYKVTWQSGCTWVGSNPYGLGITITLVFAGGTATLTFSNGLTYSGAVSCTALTLTKTANGDCTTAPTTLALCPAQDPCSDNTFIIRLTCQQCSLTDPACCPSNALPPTITLALTPNVYFSNSIYQYNSGGIHAIDYPLDDSAWTGSYTLSLSEDPGSGHAAYVGTTVKCGVTYAITVECAGSGSFLYYHDPGIMGDPVTITGTLWSVNFQSVPGGLGVVWTGFVLQGSCAPLGGATGQITASALGPTPVAGGPVFAPGCTSAGGATYPNPLLGSLGTNNASAFLVMFAAITSGGGPC